MTRMTVDEDIPRLVRELQHLERQLAPDADYWRDRNDLLRGALLYRIDEAHEQLADHERNESGDA